jgi:hypothetical protein
MPHRHNAGRRHHIPKMAFKVQNWPAYEADLRRRDSLTLWIEDAALECWQTIGPGGRVRCSDAAIQTSRGFMGRANDWRQGMARKSRRMRRNRVCWMGLSPWAIWAGSGSCPHPVRG